MKFTKAEPHPFGWFQQLVEALFGRETHTPVIREEWTDDEYWEHHDPESVQ